MKAVMILDQAPQHGEVEIPGWSELIHLAIPKKMTHIFQPADSFIIANIKRWTKCAWRGYLQQVFRDNTIAEAVKDTIVKSLPVLRARKFSFIKAALDRCGSDCVTASWEHVGILRELFGHQLRIGKEVVYDTYIDADVVVIPQTDDESDVEPIEMPIELHTVDFVLVQQPAEPQAPRRGRPKKLVAPPPKPSGPSILEMLMKKRGRSVSDID